MNNSIYDRYFSSKAYPFFNFLYVLVIGNMCWVLLNFFTFVIFSLFPASIALFIVIRSAMEDTDFPLLKAFFKIFIKEYIKSQLVFLCFLFIGSILGLAVYILQHTPSTILFSLSRLLFYILIFIYLLSIVHVIPIYVYFPNLSVRAIVKNALLLSIGLLFHSIGLLLLYAISLTLLILFPAFGTLIGFLIFFSMLTYLTIKIIDDKYFSFVRDTQPLSISNYLKEY